MSNGQQVGPSASWNHALEVSIKKERARLRAIIKDVRKECVECQDPSPGFADVVALDEILRRLDEGEA